MREDGEYYEDLDSPVAREALDEVEHEQELDRALLDATDAEFRESQILPGVPLS